MLGGRMKRCIVPIFSRKPPQPCTWTFRGITLQVSFQTMVDHLRLSIYPFVWGGRQYYGEVVCLATKRSLAKNGSWTPCHDERWWSSKCCWGAPLLSEMLLRRCEQYKGCFRGINCAYLLKRSITTSIVSIPWDWGNPLMKSIVNSFHTWVGSAMGCNKPVGETFNDLCCWVDTPCILIPKPPPISRCYIIKIGGDSFKGLILPGMTPNSQVMVFA